MPYTVLIRKNETGEERLRRIDLDWGEGSEYWWQEGNMSCDCNRANEFLRVKGAGNLDHPCGFAAYTVPWAELPDGTRVEIDQPSSTSSEPPIASTVQG